MRRQAQGPPRPSTTRDPVGKGSRTWAANTHTLKMRFHFRTAFVVCTPPAERAGLEERLPAPHARKVHTMYSISCSLKSREGPLSQWDSGPSRRACHTGTARCKYAVTLVHTISNHTKLKTHGTRTEGGHVHAAKRHPKYGGKSARVRCQHDDIVAISGAPSVRFWPSKAILE